MKCLLVKSYKNNSGGVAAYYNAILPYLNKQVENIDVLEVGTPKGHKSLFSPIKDQLNFHKKTTAKYSLIHINPSLGSRSFWRDGLFVWQAKRKGIPLLVFFRGWDHNFEKIVEKRLLFFFRNTFAKADIIIVLASEFKDKLREWGVSCPIHIETTTVDDELLQNYNLSQRIIPGIHTIHAKILFLSRIEKGKGVLETIKAIRILVDQGLRVKLSIAGDGNVREEAEHYVRKLNLTEHISFLGYVRGKAKSTVFKQHSIYCFPTSYGEGLPNSVLEAMAFGLAVVTTSVGGLKDVFQDGKMGILFENTTPENIAKQLRKLIENPSLVRDISTYNYQYAQEHFMASKVAKRLSLIYQATIF